MSDNTTQAVTIKKADAPAQWGDRGELGALADRFSTMLPNAKDFTRDEVLAIAQYCMVADINPYRGEAYFYKSHGRLQMVDGYKILVRWAQDKDPYQDRDEDLPLTDGQLHHVRVWILRDDNRHKIKEWTDLGANWKEAFELVATYADGIVTDSEGKNAPPTGWTWRQVARKRALKTALNLSHGAPSPQEMAEYRNRVNGVQTIPEDWEGAEELSGYEAERLAELRAKGREHQTEQSQLTAEERHSQFQKNVSLLRGEDVEGFDAPPGPPPATTYTPPPIWDDDGPPAESERPIPDPLPEPQPLSTNIRQLLIAANNATGGYYNHEKHILNALRAENGPDYDWPPVGDARAWADAHTKAVAYARKEAA